MQNYEFQPDFENYKLYSKINRCFMAQDVFHLECFNKIKY